METAEIFSFEAKDRDRKTRQAADRALVQQALTGDRRAFQRIVEEQKERMFSVANSVLGSPHLAEDVVQEAFIKAYRALSDFRGDACLSTWLYRITYLTAIDQKRQLDRQHKLDAAVEASLQADLDAFSGAPSGSCTGAAENSELRQQIESAVASLSHFEKTLFTLHHMQNFKLREIAEVVDRSEGTVKNILFRAIRKLRGQLQGSQSQLQEVERC